MRIGIGLKVASIAIVLLILMLIAATVSIRLISDVSDELTAVSGKQLPMSEAVAKVTVRILEQGILLQRQFVLSAENRATQDEVLAARRAINAHSQAVLKEFASARTLLENQPNDPSAHRRSHDTLRPRLEKIANRYLDFKDLAELLVGALEARDQESFAALFPDLNEAQDAIDSEVVLFRRELENLAQTSTVMTNQNQKSALRVNILLTVIAAIFGLGFAVLITRGLVRAVRNLVTGTEAVEAGQLDTKVEVISKDEVGYLTQSFNSMVGELRLKERIKDTFGKYMDPRIVTNLLDKPEIAEPGGERREMTVMFIDLKGFTSISEKLSPDDLVRMINRFFNHMTQAISNNDGVVDKFMGDAVMAFWGPPFTNDQEHARLACRAAIEALERLAEFREDVARELGDDAEGLDIDIRIGISTGEMIVGTVGSAVSKSYTVVGDPVNLGSRLEGANKAYGTRILVSDRTHAAADGPEFRFREIDLLRVKGKDQPVRVYQLLSPDLPPPDELCGLFEDGLGAYRLRAWDVGEGAFRKVLEGAPEDQPSKTYLDRIAHLRASPLPDDWDGVWVLEEK